MRRTLFGTVLYSALYRPPLVKIKQTYEVEQSTYAKLKQPKRGLREKRYLNAGKER